MMRVWALAIFVVYPFLVMAQAVPVQTGEHSSFTRVVVTIPTGADWQFGRNDAGYLLRLPGNADFDLDGFFDLIPRRRIEDVLQNSQNGELQLIVRCACFADAFLDRSNILVIDIRDGLAPETARFEEPLDAVPNLDLASTPIIIMPTPNIVTQPRFLPLVFPRQLMVDPPRREPEQQDLVGQVIAPAALAKVDVMVQPSDDPDLLALERSITQSLARGLSQGLLEPDLNQVDAGHADGVLQDLRPPGVQTRTSVDLAAIPADPHVNLTQQGQTCLPDRFFEVSKWGDGRSFSTQMGTARRDLMGEFDRIDEVAVIKLARLFIYFGFGREAIQTLQLDGASSQERQYLMAVARIIDSDLATSALFKSQISCRSSVALWAILSHQSGELDGKVDAPSVLRAFKALPRQLQSSLSPVLSARFLAIGDKESAFQALSPAQSDPEPTVATQLVETVLLRGLGEKDNAANQLTQIARTEVSTHPEAMIAFLNASVAGDVEVDDADFILADALRFENARLPIAVELGVAQTQAYLHAGRFDAARDLMMELSDEIDIPLQQNMENLFAEVATAWMDDAAFLAFAFDPTALPWSEPVQNEMARRLLSLGFPERAFNLISSTATPRLENERASLRAEAAVMLGHSKMAMTYLEDDETGTVASLADAAVGASETTQDLWRQGAWRALMNSDDPLLRDASTAVLEQDVAGLAVAAPLAGGRTLLEQSERARAVVVGLLDRFEVSPNF